jgi:hypothetical protein
MSQTPTQPSIKLPVKPLHNPLTAEHEAVINWLLPRLPVQEDMLLRAAACGIDLAGRGAKHETHVAIVNALKQNYFPNQLPTTSE